VDQRMRDIEVSSVVADNYDGGYQVGRMIVELGHRRIAFMGDLVAATVQDRLAGLRDAIADAGLPFERSFVVDLPTGDDRLGDWCDRIEARAGELLRVDPRPTAVFCSCDEVARSVYRVLGTMGLQTPGDVSLVGFDDDPLAQGLNPPLTPVRQPFETMGKVA